MTATTLATKAKTWATCFFSEANNIRSLCLMCVTLGLCLLPHAPAWGAGIVCAAIIAWAKYAKKS